MSVALGPASLTPPGQVVTFPSRTFTTLRITITGVRVADPSVPVTSRSSVGFAEVGIPGVSASEFIVMPQDLLRATGASSVHDRLSLVMTRLRSSGYPPRSDTETIRCSRPSGCPTARTFSLTGQARISPLIPDDEIDRLVGRPGSDYSGTVAYSLGRLPNDLRANAMATLDADPTTVWEPGFGAAHQAGQWLQYRLRAPVTFDHLDLQIVADGQHSVPTELTVTADGQSAAVALPPLANSRSPGSVVDVPVSFPALTGQNIRVTVDAVAAEDTLDYYSQTPITMPIGIARIGIPGVSAPPPPATIPSPCRGDLLTVDGAPLWVSVVTGSTAGKRARPRRPGRLALRARRRRAQPRRGDPRHRLGARTGHRVRHRPAGPRLGPRGWGHAAALPHPGTAPCGCAVADGHRRPGNRHRAAPLGHRGRHRTRSAAVSTSSWARASTPGGRPGCPADPGSGAPSSSTRSPTAGASTRRRSPGPCTTGHSRWTSPGSRRDGWTSRALLISALAIIACVVLVFLPRRRRREEPDEDVLADDADARPTLAVPFGAEGPRAPVTIAVPAALVTGLVAAAIATPLVGAVAGSATLVVLLVPRLRAVLGLLAVGCIVAAGVYVTVHQAQSPVPDNGAWPKSFGRPLPSGPGPQWPSWGRRGRWTLCYGAAGAEGSALPGEGHFTERRERAAGGRVPSEPLGVLEGPDTQAAAEHVVPEHRVESGHEVVPGVR